MTRFLNLQTNACIALNSNSIGIERCLKDVLYSDVSCYLKDCCFYYSSGFDATPIIECLDLVNKFIYCDIHEGLNFIDSLYKLKTKLRENDSTELFYCTLAPEWFGLYEKAYLGYYEFSRSYDIKTFHSEFSLWRKGNQYFVLIYIDFDNNAIWKNVFLKYYKRPKMICDCNFEGGIDFEYKPLDEEMSPEFWLGYGQHHKGYEHYKEVKYHGGDGQIFTLYKRNASIRNTKIS